jgi:hypothetical protein
MCDDAEPGLCAVGSFLRGPAPERALLRHEGGRPRRLAPQVRHAPGHGRGLLTTAYDPDATEAPAAAYYSEYDQYYDLYATPSAAPAGAYDQGLYATPTAAPAAGRRRLDDVSYDSYTGEGYCSDVTAPVVLEYSDYFYSSATECGSACIKRAQQRSIRTRLCK